MRRLVIVEGPDCSGKTTLARYIANACSATYMHMSGAKKLQEAMPEYHFEVFQSLEWTLNNVFGSSVVLDRSWPSELIYGREFRPHLVGNFDWQALDRKIVALDGVYIFCMDDEIEQRHAEQMDLTHPYDRAAFHGVVEAYRTLMHQMLASRDDCFHYNMKRDGSDLRKFIERII